MWYSVSMISWYRALDVLDVVRRHNLFPTQINFFIFIKRWGKKRRVKSLKDNFKLCFMLGTKILFNNRNIKLDRNTGFCGPGTICLVCPSKYLPHHSPTSLTVQEYGYFLFQIQLDISQICRV